ncbi:MAG TPA: hypothetical protein VJ976_11680, partial [Ornithinimicrobium sp.]|uniref:hypothetical protein n=1 Tax=Ornithinimicrobium sp. TaxID=1977084 RepID=UPI002B465B88
MDPIVWILIIGLVLVIAVGVWLLTRKPGASGSGDGQSQEESTADVETRRADEVERYDVGGDHVAAGDTDIGHRSEDPYDQEADEDEDPPVWQEEESPGRDTATGADVPVVEDEPAEGVHEGQAAAPVATDSQDGDREQMTYGEAEAEDFASETTYADPDAHSGYGGYAEQVTGAHQGG